MVFCDGLRPRVDMKLAVDAGGEVANGVKAIFSSSAISLWRYPLARSFRISCSRGESAFWADKRGSAALPVVEI